MDEQTDDYPPPCPPRLEQPKRPGSNRYQSPRNQRTRDAWAAARWSIDGWTLDEIAAAMDCNAKSSAFYSVQRGLRLANDAADATAAQARAAHRARLEAATAVAVEVMYKDHVHVSQGRIMKDENGVPLLDDGPKLAAADRIRSLSESIRKLDGLDAAAKVDANVTVSPQDIELAQLIRGVEAANQAREAELKGDTGQ